MQNDEVQTLKTTYTNETPNQVLPRPPTLQRHPRRDQVPLQRSLDAGLPKTSRQPENKPSRRLRADRQRLPALLKNVCRGRWSSRLTRATFPVVSVRYRARGSGCYGHHGYRAGGDRGVAGCCVSDQDRGWEGIGEEGVGRGVLRKGGVVGTKELRQRATALRRNVEASIH